MFGHPFPLKPFNLQLLSFTESAGFGDLSSTACNYPVVAGKMKKYCPKNIMPVFFLIEMGTDFTRNQNKPTTLEIDS